VDFWAGAKIAALGERRSKRLVLIISLVANLGVLGLFKYFNFFLDSFYALVGLFGFQEPLWGIHVILPVGISFYTFQSMSYTIDIYRGKLRPTRNYRDYALYVSFFPQLVAGPIVRASELLPQLVKPREKKAGRVREGFFLILYGFFKKVVVADNLAVFVDQIFAKPQAGSAEVIIGTVAFAFQIYADFSGYTDIARGVAKWMGFDFPLNFNFPYIARNPADFWHRWHMTLSQWLRDYLYIPLGGNRKGEGRTYRNLALTMLLGGLWHGAAWNFVIWGAYHGVLLMAHRYWQNHLRSGFEPALGKVPAAARTVGSISLMFCFTLYGWLIFRVVDLQQLWSFTAALFTTPWETRYLWLGVKVAAYSMLVVGVDGLMIYLKRQHLATRYPLVNLAWALFFFYMIVIFGYDGKNSFIYFAF
jgi:D-alanyl-lipoteichoic acid acyltransferase DltB (MBOAT superfamily)